MDCKYLLELLDSYSFIRSSRSFSSPIIIHGVAGCGKSTIIQKIALAFPELLIGSFTPALLDPNSGRKQLAVTSDPLDILDEYLGGPNPVVRLAKFCDPLQYSCEQPEVPHFTSLLTWRFCVRTTALLNGIFGCQIKSRREDLCHLTHENPYTTDPKGVVVAHEQEVINLLLQHGCPVTPTQHLWGLTIPVVSVYVTSIAALSTVDRANLFLSLTRHSKALHIFEFDAWSHATC
uniref:TGB1 n=1 Tax=Narcissus mosaic virus TaxID=12180 RepID=V5T901_NMV|nr:TGB1 [Narcissus mosaic virus]